MGQVVKMVRNVTDMDEPLYIKAESLKMNFMELARLQTERFRNTMAKLMLIVPEVEPLASKHTEEITNAIEELQANGYGYRLADSIYFDVSKRFLALGSLVSTG